MPHPLTQMFTKVDNAVGMLVLLLTTNLQLECSCNVLGGQCASQVLLVGKHQNTGSCEFLRKQNMYEIERIKWVVYEFRLPLAPGAHAVQSYKLLSAVCQQNLPPKSGHPSADRRVYTWIWLYMCVKEIWIDVGTEKCHVALVETHSRPAQNNFANTIE